MGHMLRLVENLSKIRNMTCWQEKFMGHLKKYEKGKITFCTIQEILSEK